MDAKKFQTALDDLLKKIGVQTATLEGVEPQIGDTLRALLPVTEAGDVVLKLSNDQLGSTVLKFKVIKES